MSSSSRTRISSKNQEIYEAIESQSVYKIKKLLEGDELCPNRELEGYDMSAMHLAVGLSQNDDQIVKLLLSHNGDPNRLNNCREYISPLHVSVLHNLDHVLELLLQYGGDPFVNDLYGKNCFDLAVECEHHGLIPILNNYHEIISRKSKSLVSNSSSNLTLNHQPQQQPVLKTSYSEYTTGGESFYSCQSHLSDKPLNVVYRKISILPLNIVHDENEIEEKEEKWQDLISDTSIKILNNVENYSSIQNQRKISPSLFPSTSTSSEIENFSSPLASSEPDTDSLAGTGPDHDQLEPFTFPESKQPSLAEIKDLQNAIIGLNLGFPVTKTTYSVLSKVVQSQSKPQVIKSPKKANTDSLADPGPGSVLDQLESFTFPESKQPSLAEIKDLQNAIIGLNLGFPVTKTTYSVLSKVVQSQSNLQIIKTPKKSKFSKELHSAIDNLSLVNKWQFLKKENSSTSTSPSPSMCKITTSKRTRGKNYYDYLLLDPLILNSVKFRDTSTDTYSSNYNDKVMQDGLKFDQFLQGIFYIGKGCGTRPIVHLVEAKSLLFDNFGRTVSYQRRLRCDKIRKINEIWKRGDPVLVLSICHLSNESEAFVNESCMIDAIGFDDLTSSNLTNMRKGTYIGETAKWSLRTKCQYGSYLLYKAFCNFVLNNGKPFYPQDV